MPHIVTMRRERGTPEKGPVPVLDRKKKPARETTIMPGNTVVKNLGAHHKRVLIGVPTLGVIRYEWHIHRSGQSIPVNWQNGEMVVSVIPPGNGHLDYSYSLAAMGYVVDDAQNVIVERAVLDNYEFLLLYEDDVLPPFDAFMRLNMHMESLKYPIISGLYFTRGVPSWPLLFRGRGNGVFTDWGWGDIVEVDGVPTGFLLIHHSVFRYMWENSEEYTLPDGKKVKRVFRTPRDTWQDPETDQYYSAMGTSDLHWCERIIRENVLGHTGWDDIAKKKYPFVVDTNIFCHHIDINGAIWPDTSSNVLWPTGGKPQNKIKKMIK